MRRPQRWICESLAAVMALGLAGCSDAPPGPRSSDAEPGLPTNADRHLDAPYLVLVSFDGFRHDYRDRFDTPNLDRLAAEGLAAEGLVPVYPSKTFPNHYSIVTGLFPENHGLTANTFWDPTRDETYRIGDRSKVEDGEWYGGEPLWVTAGRQGMVSASYFWVGSEATIGGMDPSYRHRFDQAVPNEVRVDGVLEWLRLPPLRRPHFIALYFSLVDEAGHSLGPESPDMARAVEEADRVLGLLLDGLDELPERDRIHLVVVSDHGMTEVRYRDHMDLSAFPGVRVVDAGAHVSLFLEEGSPTTARQVRDALREQLPESRVFLRGEMPTELHHRRNDRIGDVEVVVADHRVVLPLPRDGLDPSAPPPSGGSHGYDPFLVPAMRGILFAKGPGIPRGVTVGLVDAVDLYPWMAELLGLEPAEEIDGSSDGLRIAVESAGP